MDDERDPTGTDWTATELDLIVADYFAMLRAELAGEPYSKTARREALMALIKRSKGSIEFKHQNISAVLQELGMPWIKGYKPRSNYQGALLEAIERHLGDEIVLPVPAMPSVADDISRVVVEVPQRREPVADAGALAIKRLVRRFDPATRDARNRQLGKAGEAFVLQFERRRLEQRGYGQLAERVRWVAQDDGDGAGFDILSFDETGDERLLEVKTTCGVDRTPFYISRNELALSEEQPAAFRLVRVHEFANAPKMFILTPPLTEHVNLAAVSYKASWS